MTIERRNPLPVGRYWIDLVGAHQQAYADAVRALNSAHPGLIHTDSTVYHQASGSDAERTWVLFHTTGETVWDHTGIGSPTIAVASVQTESDTVQRPDPEPDVLDRLKSIGTGAQQTITTAAYIIGGSIIVAGIVAVIVSLRRK